MAFTEIYGNVYTTVAGGLKFPLQGGADVVEVIDMTKTLTVSSAGMIRGYWYGPKYGAAQTAAGGGERWYRNTTAATGIGTFSDTGGTPTAVTGIGFTYVPVVPFVEAQAANAISNISQASNAIVSQTNTYANNDILVLYNTTGMFQIAGMTFEISSVSGSQYTLIGLNSAAFAAAGSGGNTRRVSSNQAVDPEALFITGISNATQAVVTTSVNPARYYIAGMMVYFSVPSSFGMSQINGMWGQIISINAATYSMVVNINTVSFTAFAFPASTGSPTTRLFAMLASQGQYTSQDPILKTYTGYDFNFAPYHTGQFTPYLWIPTGQWSAGGDIGDNLVVRAYKDEN